MLTILQAETPVHIALARELMTEYAQMDHAIRMYRELGFREAAPDDRNPMEGVLYMELAVQTFAKSHS